MVSQNTIQQKKRKNILNLDNLFTFFVYFFLLLFCILILFPIIHIVSGSFSDPMALLRGEIKLLPKGFTLSMYQKVFKDNSIWRAYSNTIFYTVAGTAVSIFLTSTAAYALSRKDFYGRNIFMALFLFTMFFSGGMIPTFLIVQSLGMLNTIWAMILPSAVSTYNLIIMRTFFANSLPFELTESAQLDGCNDIIIFIKIALPLSGPVLAVMTLFYGVSLWNSWFPALLYLRNRGLYPLQLVLREILLKSDISNMTGSSADVELIGEGLKYATMIVATVPILCLYPFLQRYFTKGVMIGAVKG